MKKGRLYLIPSFLGNEDISLIPDTYRSIIHELTEFVVENEKPARAFLKAVNTPIPMSELVLHPIHKHIDPQEYASMLDACVQGRSMGLISDAGLPCVADPGFQIVAMAHRKGIEVFPMHGLSSVMMALMASGFNGQQFRFHGYLPHDAGEKRQILKGLLSDIKRGETQIFIETPYRNGAFLTEMKQSLTPDTEICVAVDLSLPSQQVMRFSLGNIPSNLDSLHKRPAVFVIGR